MADTLYSSKNYLSGDWGGSRIQLHETGIDIGLTYTAEPAASLSGGYKQGDTYLHNINLEFKADMQKLFGFKNTTFLAKISSRHGDNLSEKFVVPANAENGRYIYGEYFNKSQEAFGGQTTKLVNFQFTTQITEVLSIDYGRLVMNDLFLRSDVYCNFMNNATCGSPKAVFTPYALSAYPDATMGIHMDWLIEENLNLKLGIFDGGWMEQNPNGLDWSLGENGIAAVAEAQIFFERGSLYTQQKVLKVGVNHHTGEFNDFETGAVRKGNTSLYLLSDLGIYAESGDADQGLALFGAYVYNLKDEIAGLTHFLNLGFVYKGLVSLRESDKLGLSYVFSKHSLKNSYTHDNVSGKKRVDETLLELSYNFVLPYGIEIMPDLQWIHHPNGSRDFSDVTVVGIKLNVNF